MGPLWIWVMAVALAMGAGRIGRIAGTTPIGELVVVIGALFLAVGAGTSSRRRRT